MQAKSIAALLTLTLSLAQATPSLAATERASQSVAKHPAPQTVSSPSIEDNFGRDVFQVLLGEFALQRGDLKLSSEAWGDLAIRSRDPQALERAIEVAAFAHQYDSALELSRLWLAVEPDSTKARQAESRLLVMTNRLDELAPQLAKLLAEEPASIGNNLLQLNRMLARHEDKKAVQQLVDRLAAPYDTLPEAHFAMAQAATNAGDTLRALNEIEKTLQQRPDWEAAALVRAQLQLRLTPATAIDGLNDFVIHYPAAADARLALARLLITEKRYPEARAQFDRLLMEHPDDPAVIYPVAMLALQQGDTETGRQQLEKLLKAGFHDKSAIHFFLGQLDEEQGKPESALEHFLQVAPGNQFISARARAALILQQQGKLEEGRKLLHVAAANDDEKTRLLLAEAQLLRQAGQDNEALGLLESALVKQADNLDLLYESAMLADRLGKYDLLERRLKHLLVLKPDNPQALNALGYSWADRNINLGEAEQLIAKALQQLPDDPFIMDSLGWVFFRQGRLNESQATLARAYGIRPDPEIAAHLGEVLWTLNRKEEARHLLEEAARKDPKNELLTTVIKKLLP